jgi:putative phosphoesterase
MRIAALYDIHGNLPALEAVLEDLGHSEVTQIVVGGDVVPGPMPREVMERLSDVAVPVQCIRGNCEREMLAIARGAPSTLPQPVREAMRWSARQLFPDYQPSLQKWPATLRCNIDGLGEILFCHGTPRDDNEIFTRKTPEDRLLPIFQNAGAEIVICGHTHMQFDRRIGSTSYQCR